jgi:hypothetical protein
MSEEVLWATPGPVRPDSAAEFLTSTRCPAVAKSTTRVFHFIYISARSSFHYNMNVTYHEVFHDFASAPPLLCNTRGVGDKCLNQ